MTNNSQMIIIISSPSGAGKTSICKELLKKDQNLKISISDTTRTPRHNEIDGKHYNFISEEMFKNKINNNEYAEHAFVFNNYYGSLSKDVLNLLDKGFDVLFDIDWQGAKQLKNSDFSNILSFFIMPPSRDEIQKRLNLRAEESGDDENAINNRMSYYDTEIKHKDEYDHVIINDNFEECIKKICNLIKLKRIKL